MSKSLLHIGGYTFVFEDVKTAVCVMDALSKVEHVMAHERVNGRYQNIVVPAGSVSAPGMSVAITSDFEITRMKILGDKWREEKENEERKT